MMRLFIGLGLGGDARDALAAVVSGLKIQGQFTPADNFHLTLAFLGMREERQAAGLKTIVAETAVQCPPLRLAITGLGFFGRRENALLHAKFAPSAPLRTLSDTLRRLLAGAGETFDEKPFVPHITLARKADLTAADLRSSVQPIAFGVNKLTLYHSVRIQDALRYRPIYEAPFQTKDD